MESAKFDKISGAMRERLLIGVSIGKLKKIYDFSLTLRYDVLGSLVRMGGFFM